MPIVANRACPPALVTFHSRPTSNAAIATATVTVPATLTVIATITGAVGGHLNIHIPGHALEDDEENASMLPMLGAALALFVGLGMAMNPIPPSTPINL